MKKNMKAILFASFALALTLFFAQQSAFPSELHISAVTTQDKEEIKPEAFFWDHEELFVSIEFLSRHLKGEFIQQSHDSYSLYINGKQLLFAINARNAKLNKYEIDFFENILIKNNCLYVKANFFQTYFNIILSFDQDSNSLQVQTGKEKIILLKNTLKLTEFNSFFLYEIPVVVGLNDPLYERKLNEIFKKDAEQFQDEYFVFHDSKDKHYFAKNTIESCHLQNDILSLYELLEHYDGNMEMIRGHAKNLDLRNQRILHLGHIVKPDFEDFFQEQKQMTLDIDQMTDFYIKPGELILFFEGSDNGVIEFCFRFDDIESLLVEDAKLYF